MLKGGHSQHPRNVKKLIVEFSAFRLTLILSVKLLLSNGAVKVAFVFCDERALSADLSEKCQGEDCNRSLNKDQKYWFAIDAFGENGITPGDMQ